jgi:IclR family KDG regulon transcriptional repressor
MHVVESSMSEIQVDTTLLKGVALLEALATSERPRGVSELAAELGIVKSTVHRILQTLVRCGYVRKSDDPPRYQCSLRMFEFGALLADRIDIKIAAGPYMRRLADKTRESVLLSILDGGEVVYLDKIDSSHSVRAYARTGGRTPAYCSAAGKALLAYEPDDTLDSLLPLRAFTAKTLVDLDSLRKELESTRARGYAINYGEWRDGVCGIAAPIPGVGSRLLGALSISGPTDRLKPTILRKLAPLLIDTANGISESLGLRPAVR